MLRLIGNQEQNRIVSLETLEHRLLLLRFCLPNVSTSHPHHLHQEEAVAADRSGGGGGGGRSWVVSRLSNGTRALVNTNALGRARNTYVIRSNSNPMGSRGISRTEYNTCVEVVLTLWHKPLESQMTLEYLSLVLMYISLPLMILTFQSLLNFVQ